jgi:hypothetical protein
MFGPGFDRNFEDRRHLFLRETDRRHAPGTWESTRRQFPGTQTSPEDGLGNYIRDYIISMPATRIVKNEDHGTQKPRTTYFSLSASDPIFAKGESK